MEEIWKDIKGYDNYQVSSLGRIKNTKTGRVLKGHYRKGYETVDLSKNCIVTHYSVHRLVAQAFIPNPDNLPCVNHLDEIKPNNNVENLEWCTIKYNNNYGTARQRGVETCRRNNTHALNPPRSVEQYDLDGNYMQTFSSIREAYISLNRPVGSSQISRAINNNGTSYGFKWKYAH